RAPQGGGGEAVRRRQRASLSASAPRGLLAGAASGQHRQGRSRRPAPARPRTSADGDEGMRAAVIYEHGGPGSIKIVRDFPDPQPGPEGVILKVRFTPLNYHDIFTRRGLPGTQGPPPAIAGSGFP